MIEAFLSGLGIGICITGFLSFIRHERQISELRADARDDARKRQIAEHERDMMEIELKVQRDRSNRLSDRIADLLEELYESKTTHQQMGDRNK